VIAIDSQSRGRVEAVAAASKDERALIGVPLDQGGNGADPPERFGVELPDRLRYPRAVVVDQDVHILGGVMAGEMDLTDLCRRQRVDIGDRVEPARSEP
jgi:hypothetical protein